MKAKFPLHQKPHNGVGVSANVVEYCNTNNVDSSKFWQSIGRPLYLSSVSKANQQREPKLSDQLDLVKSLSGQLAKLASEMTASTLPPRLRGLLSSVMLCEHSGSFEDLHKRVLCDLETMRSALAKVEKIMDKQLPPERSGRKTGKERSEVIDLGVKEIIRQIEVHKGLPAKQQKSYMVKKADAKAFVTELLKMLEAPDLNAPEATAQEKAAAERFLTEYLKRAKAAES